MREREDLHAEVNQQVHREHTELTVEIQKLRKLKLSPNPTYAKVVSCGMQTVPAPSMPTPVPVLQREVSTSTNSKGKGKGKEKRKDEEGDTDMKNRFHEYEDLSDYEAAPPAVNKLTPATRAV